MQGLRCVSSLPHDGPPVLDSHSQKRPDGYSELGRQGVPVGIAVEDGHDLGDDNPRPAERIHRGSRRPSGVQDIVHNRHPLARPQCRDVHHRLGVPGALPERDLAGEPIRPFAYRQIRDAGPQRDPGGYRQGHGLRGEDHVAVQLRDLQDPGHRLVQQLPVHAREAVGERVDEVFVAAAVDGRPLQEALPESAKLHVLPYRHPFLSNLRLGAD